MPDEMKGDPIVLVKTDTEKADSYDIDITVTAETESQIDGDTDYILDQTTSASIAQMLDGEYGNYQKVNTISGDTYSGPTEITPTRGTQVLATNGKVLVSNITVKPIPQNYGLITWDGRKITVS